MAGTRPRCISLFHLFITVGVLLSPLGRPGNWDAETREFILGCTTKVWQSREWNPNYLALYLWKSNYIFLRMFSNLCFLKVCFMLKGYFLSHPETRECNTSCVYCESQEIDWSHLTKICCIDKPCPNASALSREGYLKCQCLRMYHFSTWAN